MIIVSDQDFQLVAKGERMLHDLRSLPSDANSNQRLLAAPPAQLVASIEASLRIARAVVGASGEARTDLLRRLGEVLS